MIKITIGARGSKLSIAYVEKVKELLIQKNNDLKEENIDFKACLLYTSPSPRDRSLSRMPSSA